MFFKGIYKWHLTAILLVSVAILFICMLFAFSNNKPQYNPIEKYKTHTCVDPDHSSCDGNCECDGLGCNESDKTEVLLTNSDYILRIQNDETFVLYDRDGRIVHVFNRSYKPNHNLFIVVDKDNE